MKHVLNLIKSVDNFGETVNFQIAGKPTFASWSGAILTLIVYLLTLIYAQQKLVTMMSYGDTNFQTKTIQVTAEEQL